MSTEAPVMHPTVPGKAPGIIGWNPLRMQCSDCGVIHEQCSKSIGVCILTAGFQFHRCEDGSGKRRCPMCLVRVLNECGTASCLEQARDLIHHTEK